MIPRVSMMGVQGNVSIENCILVVRHALEPAMMCHSTGSESM